MEKDIRKIEHDLNERLKELQCLYDISNELESGHGLDSMLRNSAHFLRIAFQFPSITSTHIHVYGKDYYDNPCTPDEILRTLSMEIVVRHVKKGFIRAGYCGDAEFLKEEEKLIMEIGWMISKALERRELQEELQLHISNLESLVKAKTAELEKSQRQYEDLFEYAPDGVVISRLNGDIIKANRAFYRMLRYPEDGSIQLNFIRNNLYQDLPTIRPYAFMKLYEQGVLEGLEMNLIDRDGNIVPVLGSFIFIDIDGERCVEEVYKDIRFRKEIENSLIEQNEKLESMVKKRTEDLENQRNLLMTKNRELVSLTDQLSESKAKLQTLFHAITDTVVMIDRDYTIQMSNKTDITDGKCYQRVFQLDHPCPNCPGSVVFQRKQPHRLEVKHGDDYYALQIYPILGEGNEIRGAIEFSRLITKEKNMEYQLLQTDKMASLGQLVSGVAHEINNPNTFIRGNIAILQEAFNDILPILDAHAAANGDVKIARLKYDLFRQHIPVLIADMVQGANRIKSIVDGLKEYAKKDDGVLNDAVDMNHVIDQCLRLVQNQVKRSAKVNVDLDTTIPPVRGNFQKLEQVIINMLINASQALEKDRGVINVSTAHDAGSREVSISICDNGKGMEEKTIKQIFDPFFTTKRNQGGTGLGLSIAYRIIKEHKGRIDVESAIGEGTTFTIYLPQSQ